MSPEPKKLRPCYPRKYATETRDPVTREKITAYVGSCAPCAFQAVKTTKSARDKALEPHTH